MTDVDLAGAAALVGRSYDWFSRNWRTLTHPATSAPFPRPFVGAEKGARPRWVRAVIDAWKAGAAPPAAADTAWHPAQRARPAAAANDAAAHPLPPDVDDLVAAAGG
jgi:hypothetical protein